MTEDKFRNIYNEHYQIVSKVVYSVLRDADFSEDICQEVFLLFSEKADQLNEEFYRQWLIVTAKRKAIDFCRKSYQVHEVSASFSESEEGIKEKDGIWTSSGAYTETSAEEKIMHKLALMELAGGLFADLKKKNEDWYEILSRTVLKEEKPEDIARALGISVENLRAKKHRMKVWVNKRYRERFDEL